MEPLIQPDGRCRAWYKEKRRNTMSRIQTLLIVTAITLFGAMMTGACLAPRVLGSADAGRRQNNGVIKEIPTTNVTVVGHPGWYGHAYEITEHGGGNLRGVKVFGTEAEFTTNEHAASILAKDGVSKIVILFVRDWCDDQLGEAKQTCAKTGIDSFSCDPIKRVYNVKCK